MRKRAKKAAFLAAFSYLAVLGLGCGMLRAAQRTRQTLYGGQPVMAQIARQELPEHRTACTLTLGGGEWRLHAVFPSGSGAAQAAEQLPPCMLKLLLRLAIDADAAAAQIAECISGR